MSFAAEWLELREPADRAARNAGLLLAAATAARETAKGDRPVIVDLGCGTGSTARAFAELLPSDACWRLVDNDAALLDVAIERARPNARGFCLDLCDVERLPLEGAHLVSASALLDLMPQAWVKALARRLARAGIGFYAALNYDGRMTWDPPLPGDAAVTSAFNRHQRGDKGLGPALGPEGGSVAAGAFQAEGFDVSIADSPWLLSARHSTLQDALLRGVETAALDMGAATAAQWGRARRDLCATSSCRVGHLDVLALPSR